MSLTKIFVNNQDTGFDGNVYHKTGDSTTAPMSQKAVTDELNDIRNNGCYDKEAEYDFDRSAENAFSPITQITSNEPILDVYPGKEGILTDGRSLNYHTRVFSIPQNSKGKRVIWAGGQITFVYELPDSFAIGTRLKRVTKRLQSDSSDYTFTIPSNATYALVAGYEVPSTLELISSFKGKIVQETGNSEDRIMSQKATTDVITEIKRTHSSNYDFVKCVNNDLYSQYGDLLYLGDLPLLDTYPSTNGILVDGTSLGYHSKYASLTPSALGKQLIVDNSIQLTFVYETPTSFEVGTKLKIIDERKTPSEYTAYTIPTNAVGVFVGAYTVPSAITLQSSRLKEYINDNIFFGSKEIILKYAPMQDVGYLRFAPGTNERYLWEEKKLQNIGDYLEFNYIKSSNDVSYSFAGFLAKNSSLIGITVLTTTQSIRTNLNNWVILNQAVPFIGNGGRIRFEIVDGGIKVEQDGVQIAMYNYTFGEGEYISIQGYGAPGDS